MIRDISILNWFRFLIAFFLFLGPGYALLSFYLSPFSVYIKKFSTLALGFGISISFWIALMLWLRVIHVTVTPLLAVLISVVGWGIIVFKYVTKPFLINWKKLGIGGFEILEGFIFILCCTATLWGIRHQVVALGSDSYHHTLIASMIFSSGEIPSNYLPYAPIITFSYHFGYHVLVAVLGWLSNWPIRLLVLVTGPICVAMTGLAMGLLIGWLTHSKLAEISTFVIVSFFTVFPSYMLNWGRYTQLLGTFLLIVFLFIFFYWREKGYIFSGAFIVALVAVGLSLSHYRITIMGIIGMGLYLVIEIFLTDQKEWRKYVLPWGAALLVCMVIVSPWVWETYTSHLQGISIVHPLSDTSSFYSTDRLGPVPNNYPTNIPLFVFSFFSIAYGLWKKDRFIIWIIIWWGALFLLSDPHLLADKMDRVTSYISLYVPVGLLCGWLVSFIDLKKINIWQRNVLLILCLTLVSWGSYAIARMPEPSQAFAYSQDLPTLEWIKSSTPRDAVFMVNTFSFPFAPDYVIGSDAGYWLPLLGDRLTVVPPMSYQTERFSSRDMVDRLARLNALNGHLATTYAVRLLHEFGVSYIYVSSRGGNIQVQELLSSSDYELKHKDNGNYVFQLLEKP